MRRFRLKVWQGKRESVAEFLDHTMAEALVEPDGIAHSFLSACFAQGGVTQIQLEEIGEPEPTKPMGAA